MKKVFNNLSFILLIFALILTVAACNTTDKPGENPGPGDGGDTHTHQYTEEVTKAPSCTEAGEKTFTCSCGDSYTEAIEKLSHTEEVIAAVAPTCTETGLTEGKKCSVCGTELKAQESVPATDHSFTDEYDADCNNEGCDFVREVACRHSNTEILAAVEATCTTAGLTEGLKCKDCEEILTKQETVSALGHKYTPVVTAPTCTAGGYTTYTCSACNDSYVADEVSALGHTEKTLAAVAPTCTETGLTAGKQCTVCNTVTEEQKTIDATGHTEKTLAAVAPTCTETGLTEGKQCIICSAVTQSQQVIDANGHTASSAVKENVKDSTCSAAGSYDSVVYCSVCSTEMSRKTETIEKKAHTEVIDAAVAPTCTETGLTEGKHCLVCNALITAQKVVPALGHTEAVVPGKAATCTTTGLTDGKKCSVCNAELEAQKTIPVRDHDVRILAAEAATCTKAGKTEGKYCFECGVTIVAQTEIPKIAHSYDNDSDLICNVCNTERACLHADTVVVPGKAATCTESGLKDGTKCKICGDVIIAQEVIPATGHQNQVKIPAVAPTCTADGSTEGLKCFTCGTVLVQPEVITKKGHTEKILPAVAATCTKTGLTEGKQCTVCNEILVAQEITSKLDHTYSSDWSKDGTVHWHACKVCGDKADESNHAYTTEVEGSRVNASCEKDGKYTLECVCGATKDVVLPATDHSYSDEWTETETQHWHACSSCGAKKDVANHDYATEVEGSRVDATCTANGSYTLICVCGATKQETILSEGHSYVSTVTPPTCTDGGFTTHVCSKCSDSYKDSLVDALGHSYDSVVTSPTCTEGGYTTYTCSVCGGSKVGDEVEALGHAWKDATCTTPKTCSTCGTTEGEAKGHAWKDATCTAPKTCSDCGATEGEVLPHTYPEQWTTDDNQHWRECTGEGCDAKEIGDHDVYNKNCFCGYVNEHRVVNGNFENGLEGWTSNNTVGDAPFADIDEKPTFWGEGYAMFNVGKYFSSYADGAAEGSQGTLASSYFVAGGKYATYMLGGAGNHNVYITIEDKDGNVLALYRNTKFADFPAGDFSLEDRRAMIGNTVFLANFVSYKVDISAWEGKEIRFVVHDHASEGWGVVYFDQLNTYHTAEPEGLLAENLLANKSALNAELALEIKEQGDYTLDSFNVYLEKLAAAKALANDVAVAQANVDAATSALTDARKALVVRPVEAVEGANKSFNLISGNSKEITLADYINTNGLSGITYEIIAEENVTIGEISDGKFTITAGAVSQTTVVNVKITVCHNGTAKLSVDLSVQITNDVAPTVFNAEVNKNLDLYELDNKESITLDLSENVDNAGNLALTYSVNGSAVDGSAYTYRFSSYNEAVVHVTLNVTVYYTANGVEKSISYTYKLALKDTTDYRLENGGFENGLEGWTQVGNIGGVSSDTHYWLNDPERAEGYEFGMDGNGMFSAYAPGASENAVGTLTSSTFKVGGSGYVTFKLGAAKDANYVYVEVCDFVTGKILARYSNANWADRTEGAKSGCTLNAYRADLSAYMGRTLSFRVVDTAYNDYGLFFVDSFETYYESAPEGFADAVECDRYNIANGSFESGNLNGWTMNIQNGGAFNTLGWVQNSERAEGWYTTNEGRKDGNFLFTFYSLNGENCENTTGTLTSSTFTLKKNTYISFKFGAAGSSSVSVRLIKTDGTYIASFYNESPYKVNTELHSYYYHYTGEETDCYILIIDNAESNYGCFVVDDFRVNLETKPSGYRNAAYGANVNYDIANGSFEDGLDGWTMNITEAGSHNTLGWVERSEHNADWYSKNDDTKDGHNLFTFARPDGTNCENSKGTLQSATFTLKQNAFVSFKFGGAGGAQNHDVYIELCKEDGSVIARFYNDAPGKVNTRMNAYFYQYTGEETNCFFRVVDNSTGDYGCFVVDDFRANLESAPEGYIAAIQ